jgi:hypothetical protein
MDRDSPRPYTLPRDVQERLTVALKRFRNREAAHTLAVFLARYWSSPGKLVQAFTIDRRSLSTVDSKVADLNLTEDRIRGAIKTLEAIGFVDRTVASGSLYKATEDGLRKKPIRFHFGTEYGLMFAQANRRAAAARGRRSEAGRPQVLVNYHRASAAFPEARDTSANLRTSPNSPKNRNPSGSVMNLGEINLIPNQKKVSGIPPLAFERNERLESALDRLLQGIRLSRGSG